MEKIPAIVTFGRLKLPTIAPTSAPNAMLITIPI